MSRDVYTLDTDEALREKIAQGRVSEYDARMLSGDAVVTYHERRSRGDLDGQIRALRFAVDVLQWAEAHQGHAVQLLISEAARAVEMFSADELEEYARLLTQGRAKP